MALTQNQWDAERPARRLRMLGIAFEMLGLNVDELQAMPTNDALWAIAKSYEERGITKAELDGWVAACDPVHPVDRSTDDCFRAKMREALKEPMSVPTAVAIAGAVGFGGALAIRAMLSRR